MPKITRDLVEQDRLENLLLQQYENDERTGLHVSDFTGCLRKPVLMKEQNIPWDVSTLLMFTLGRGFEKAIGQSLLDDFLQEVEVKEAIEGMKDPLEGHIDFGQECYYIETDCGECNGHNQALDWGKQHAENCPNENQELLDYEFKLTWKWYPETQEDLENIFESNWYWLDQAGTYAIMRRRKACRFAMLHISSRPEPRLNVIRVEWSEQEQAELWLCMKNNILHVDQMKKEGKYPIRVWDKRLCRYCKVKRPCDRIGD